MYPLAVFSVLGLAILIEKLVFLKKISNASIDVARSPQCSLPNRLPTLIPKGWPYESPGWSKCEPREHLRNPGLRSAKFQRPSGKRPNSTWLHFLKTRSFDVPRELCSCGE